jgi:Flp pilus assembly protein TadD
MRATTLESTSARRAVPADGPAAEDSSGRSRVWGAALIIVLSIAAVYANSLAGEFIFDDYHDIVNSSGVRQLWPLWDVVSTVQGDGRLLLNPRPVAAFSFAANYALGGMVPWHFHLVNVAIHIVAGLALFGIARRTLLFAPRDGFAVSATPLALVIALVWSLHPLCTAAVDYIVQRYESLMGMFYLLSLYAAVRSLASPRPSRWIAASALACLLAMGSKEVAVSVPLVVLLYDRAFVSGSFVAACKRHGRLHAALAATWLIAVPYYLKFSGGGGAISSTGAGFAGFNTKTSWQAYALTQAEVILHYLRLCFWPVGQSFDYDWPLAGSVAQVAPALCVIALLLAATLWLTIRRPAWGFWGDCFFLILAPTSSVMPVVDAAFEHRMYLPLAAVVAGAVIAADGVWRRATVPKSPVAATGQSPVMTWAPVALAVIVIVALASQTMARNEVFRSPLSVYAEAVEHVPTNARAHLGLAIALHLAGDDRTALEEVDRALAMGPAKHDMHKTRGIVLGQLDRSDEALAEFDREEALFPGRPGLYECRGKVYFRLGRYADAIKDYTRQIQVTPRDAAAYDNRAMCLEQLGAHELAIADCSRAIELDRWMATAYWHRGVSRAALNQSDLALADFDQALRLNPQLRFVYQDRATLYEKRGQLELSRQDLESFERLGRKQL